LLIVINAAALSASIRTHHAYLICFFFASRRRHTRCYRDWSSDVCSSDLDLVVLGREHEEAPQDSDLSRSQADAPRLDHQRRHPRSEERRVGKECRCRGQAEHEKKTRTTEDRAKSR